MNPPFDKSASPLDKNDPVGRLLTEAPLPVPDSWFTARTLARCRNSVADPEGWSWLRLSRWLTVGGVALSLAIFWLLPSHPILEKSAQQTNVQAAFEIVASVGSDADTTSSPDSSL